MEARQEEVLVYPESDGRPMADNTLQFEWIVTLKENLDALLPDFVAGDLLWYPVAGEPWTCAAPDVLVALGRPKGHRGSYKQWAEDGVAPQVVFEVLSPSNTAEEMARKRQFYARYGVEEYYQLDPEPQVFRGWLRRRGRLVALPELAGHTSPRLGVRFDREGERWALFAPDGARFERFGELRERAEAERDRAEAAEEQIETERARAEAERARAAAAEGQAEAERERAEAAEGQVEAERARAEVAQRQAEVERARAEALAERLRALGLDLDEL